MFSGTTSRSPGCFERTAGRGAREAASCERERRRAAAWGQEGSLDEHGFKDVGLDVRNGVGRLTGTAPTGARNLEAAVVARSVPGVRAVQDDLRLRD